VIVNREDVLAGGTIRLDFVPVGCARSLCSLAATSHYRGETMLFTVTPTPIARGPTAYSPVQAKYRQIKNIALAKTSGGTSHTPYVKNNSLIAEGPADVNNFRTQVVR